MSLSKTSISSRGPIASGPTETYGSGPVILRIGNGGAGATGLIRVLAEDYLSRLPQHQSASITWVCNHSRNTQLALLHDYVDIALTYERSMEAVAEEEGWSKTSRCVFHDHFVLAGPRTDPADLTNCEDLRGALLQILQLGSTGGKGVIWHARNDDSATMWKERALWCMAREDMKPWENAETSDWYQMGLSTPAEAIQKADLAGAYLLTDRSTLLRQTAQRTVHSTTVFFEPMDELDVLMNSCYALLSEDEDRNGNGHREAFLDYVIGEKGQGIIEGFGIEAGLPLFATVTSRFSKRPLKGGLPREGRWTTP